MLYFKTSYIYNEYSNKKLLKMKYGNTKTKWYLTFMKQKKKYWKENWVLP